MDNFASVSEPVVVLKFFCALGKQYKLPLPVFRLIPSRLLCNPFFSEKEGRLSAAVAAPKRDVPSQDCWRRLPTLRLACMFEFLQTLIFPSVGLFP